MKIAILHYHLGPGGVTKVIGAHLRALSEVVDPKDDKTSLEVAVLHGGQPGDMPDRHRSNSPGLSVTFRSVDGLDYRDAKHVDVDLSAAVLSALAECDFTAGQTIVHIHNHSLGKHPRMPRLTADLARQGYRLLLHIHDFAEDLRPQNYRQQVDSNEVADYQEPVGVFPQARHIQYAALNGRDGHLLTNAGIAESHCGLIPNPIDVVPRVDDWQRRAKSREHLGVRPEASFLIYPVRAIRRKNVGEAVAWASAWRDEAHVAVTLPPITPIEKVAYGRWRKFAETHDIPIRFDVGMDPEIGFEEVIEAGDAMLTTSVAEGFGLVFLESWLFGRPLLGRDLPEITQDFVDSGIKLDSLYSQLMIPTEWIDRDEFARQFTGAFVQARETYGFQDKDGVAQSDRQIAQWWNDGRIDFAALTTSLQLGLLARIEKDEGMRAEFRGCFPFDSIRLAIDEGGKVIKSNQVAIRQHYSSEAIGRVLLDNYQRLFEQPNQDVPAALEGQSRILDQLLNVSRFLPIRTET